MAEASGPLQALVAKSKSNSLSYPEDLGTSQKNHYIIFNVFKTKTGILNYVQLNILASSPNPQVIASPDVVNVINAQTGALPSDGTIGPNASTDNGSGFTRRNHTTTTTSVAEEQIALYIPEEVSLNENAQYGEASLANALGDLTGGIVKKLTTYIDKGGSALLRLGLNSIGYVFNPQEQLMFEGIDFRKFSMSFTFTPSSENEAIAVNNIIKTFRKNAAPDIGGIFGFFFIPPSQFNITYYKGDGPNPYIHKFKRSVLEDVTVNYAPNGWAAHTDGAPVQTTLTLTFKELELVTRSDIEQLGY